MAFHQVYEALDPERCAICHVSLESVERYLWSFLYEGVNDPWFRPEFIKARGFCPVHAWQLTTIFDSATGVAIVYRHLLEEFQKAFVGLTGRQAVGTGSRSAHWSSHVPRKAGRSIKAWLEPQTPCPACRDQWRAEDRSVAATVRAVADSDFRARYETSLGLCVRHLTGVIDQPHEPEDLEWLMQAERRVNERLIHQLSEFWRKHDYRFRNEPMGEEGKAWRRVLHKMNGAAGIVWR